MSPTASTKSADHTPEDDKPIQTPSQENEYEDAEKNYNPRSLKFWSVMLGMYFAIFLVALDRTIIAVAIPAITNEFSSISSIGWYGSAYMLTCACFNPIFGRIYQLYSTKWVFLSAILIFEVGSAICGAAPNSVAFIIGRAIAGLGAAGCQAGGFMIIIPLVPLRKRPTYVAIFGMAFGLSSVLGPIIGGSFTDSGSQGWRWCFYINLPIGAFTMLAMLFFLHIDSPPREKLSLFAKFKRLDPLGIFFFIPSMVCLILALQWGGTTYAWSEPKIIGLLVTFAVLFVGFIVVEALTPETAMAPSRVVLQRSIAGSMVYTFLIYGGTMAIIYYIAIWFQAVKGDTATHAGISTIPLVIAMVVFSIFAAKFTERIGYYVPCLLLAPVLCATGAGMLSTMTRFSGHGAWIGYQVLVGLGLGCGFQQANLAAQNVLSRKDIPLGMALMFFMMQLGGSVFLSVGQNIFSTQLVQRLSGVAAKIVNTGATDLRKVVPADELDTVVDAYNYAITRVFLMSAILCAVMVLAAACVEWKSIKGKKSNGDAEKPAQKVEEAKAEAKV